MKNRDSKVFGRVFLSQRLRLGFTQGQVAFRCATSKATLSKFENGLAKNISFDLVAKLFRAVGSDLMLQKISGGVKNQKVIR